MTELILARHGETEWNITEVFRGRCDVELNENGIRQAELLADYLAGLEIDAIYSSPLRRASVTADIIASRHKLDVQVADGLVDLDYGEWQGLTHSQVGTGYTELYAQWLGSPHKATMPGGESLDDVRKRAVGLVNEVIARYSGTAVLVSHRVVNKVLICAPLGLDNSHFWNIRQDTCGMTTFIYEEGRFILSEHNNTSYLKLLRQEPQVDF